MTDKKEKIQEGLALATQNDIVEGVLAKVNQFEELGQLILPKDYSAANALKAAYLILIDMEVGPNGNKKKVLEATTKVSQANALLKMVTLALNPTKNQGSFIVYGNELTFQKEYAGTIAIAKRTANVKNVYAECIYEGDELITQIKPDGHKELVKHEQPFDNIDTNKLKGAYCVVNYNDGSHRIEVMNMHQIRTAWNQGAMKGNSPAHKNFPDQMAKKTVINRALKVDVNSSDDGHLYESDVVVDHKLKSSNQDADENAATEDVKFEEITGDGSGEALPPADDNEPAFAGPENAESKSAIQPKMDF